MYESKHLVCFQRLISLYGKILPFCNTLTNLNKKVSHKYEIFIGFKFLRGGGGCGGGGSTAIRRNVADFYLPENKNDRIKLNEALGRMKSKSNDDWSSFSNIANYHGKPYMCDMDW